MRPEARCSFISRTTCYHTRPADAFRCHGAERIDALPATAQALRAPFP